MAQNARELFLFSEQPSGDFHIPLLHCLQPFHGGCLGIWMGCLCHCLVDHGPEILFG